MNGSSVQSAFLSERTGLAVCILPDLDINVLSTSTSEFLPVGYRPPGCNHHDELGSRLVSLVGPKKAQNLMRFRRIAV